jgi:hypothetical protein
VTEPPRAGRCTRFVDKEDVDAHARSNARGRARRGPGRDRRRLRDRRAVVDAARGRHGLERRADETIKQHGRTPLDGLQPAITIRNDSGTTQTFAAQPAGEPGRYEATVVFPGEGTWSYVIDDGFTRTHTFAPVTIVGSGADSSFPTVTVTVALALALGLATLLVLLLRRRRPQPGLVAPTH